MASVGGIVGLGEVLWDLLPEGPQLGGAPFNFSYHCHQLGHPATVVSRVGADERGEAIRKRMREAGLADQAVQTDPVRPTGTVTVAVDAAGQPSYTIHEGVAWDALEWTGDLERLMVSAQAVCFGTLIQRTEGGRDTVRRAVRAARNAIVVCDINLRQRFWTPEVVEESLLASRWAKLNGEELEVLRGELWLRGRSETELLASLRQRYKLELVALTLGAKGCLVQTADEEVSVGGVQVKVADTVGAGDAFTAGLLTAVLAGASVGDATAFANRLASRVAGSPGGTPSLSREELDRLRGG